jgi:hypothetical protein
MFSDLFGLNRWVVKTVPPVPLPLKPHAPCAASISIARREHLPVFNDDGVQVEGKEYEDLVLFEYGIEGETDVPMPWEVIGHFSGMLLIAEAIVTALNCGWLNREALGRITFALGRLKENKALEVERVDPAPVAWGAKGDMGLLFYNKGALFPYIEMLAQSTAQERTDILSYVDVKEIDFLRDERFRKSVTV